MVAQATKPPPKGGTLGDKIGVRFGDGIHTVDAIREVCFDSDDERPDRSALIRRCFELGLEQWLAKRPPKQRQKVRKRAAELVAAK